MTVLHPGTNCSYDAKTDAGTLLNLANLQTSQKAHDEGTLARIDVFIPCYKYGCFLYQCVNSVLDQAGVDVRVLVIDDASPDNTAEVAAALAREDPG